MVVEENDIKKSLKEKLKEYLFKISLELLKEREKNVFTLSIMILLSFLQLTSLTLDTKLGLTLASTTPSLLQSSIKYFRILPILSSLDNTYTYLLITFSLIGFLLLYTLQLVYVGHSLNQNKFQFYFPVKILRTQSTFFYFLLFLPAFECFLNIMQCEGGIQIHALTQEVCWSGLHFFYVVCCVVFIGVAFAVVLFIAFFFNDSCPCAGDPMRRFDANFEVYFVVFRAVVAIVPNIGLLEDRFIYAVIHVVPAVAMAYVYVKYLPYYNPKISNVIGIGVVTYLWFSFNFFSIQLLNTLTTSNFEANIFALGIGICLLVPGTMIFIKKKELNVLFNTRSQEFKDLANVNIYLRKILDLGTNCQNDDNQKVLFIGFIEKHKIECDDFNCPCKDQSGELYLPITDQSVENGQPKKWDDYIFVIHLIQHLFKLCLSQGKFHKSTGVYLLFSDFLFKRMGNVHMALIHLQNAENSPHSFQQSFAIYRNKNIIEDVLKQNSQEKINSRNFDDLDVTQVIHFENTFYEFEGAIKNSTSKNVTLWDHLSSLLPDIQIFHKIGLEILSSKREVLTLWKKLSNIYSECPKALFVYGLYKRNINNEEKDGIQLVDKAELFKFTKSKEENMNNFEKMFAEDTGIVCISGNSSDSGKITWTNSGITPLFGYTKKEILGQDITLLMPNEVAIHHTDIMQRFFISGKKKNLDKTVKSFGIHRSGYVFPISLLVKMVPELNDSIQYIGLIREIDKEFEFIMTDTEGKISCISKELSGKLSLPPKLLKAYNIYLQLLCPDLFDIVQGNGTILTQFDLIDQITQLNFILPFDMWQLAADFSTVEFTKKKVQMISEKSEKNQKKKKKVSEMITNQSGETNYAKMFSELSIKEACILHKQNILKQVLNLTPQFNFKTEFIEGIFDDGRISLNIFKLKIRRFGKRALLGSENSSSEDDYSENISFNSPRRKVSQISPSKSQLTSEFPKVEHQIKLAKKFHKLLKPSKPIKEKKAKKATIKIRRTLILKPEQDFFGSGKERNKVTGERSLEVAKRSNFLVEKEKKEKLDREEDKSGIMSNTNTPHTFEVSELRPMQDNIPNPFIDMEEDDELNPLENLRKNQDDGPKRSEHPNDTASIVSSVDSLVGNFERLRYTSPEMFKSPAIINLKRAGKLIFFIIIFSLVLNITLTLRFESYLQRFVDLFYQNNNRIRMIVGIASNTRALVLLNKEKPQDELYNGLYIERDPENLYNYANIGYSDHDWMTYEDYIRENLQQFAIELKLSQNKIRKGEFRDEIKDDVNHGKIEIMYNNENGLQNIFIVDISTAILTLAVHAHSIKNLDLQDCVSSQSSISFVLQNSFNNILTKIQNSSDAILKDAKIEEAETNIIFVCIFVIATVGLIASIALTTPVFGKVRKNKLQTLSLFLDIPMKHVAEQKEICLRFLTYFEGTDVLGESNEGEDVSVKMAKNDDRSEIKPLLKNRRTTQSPESHSKRKFKPFALNILKMLLHTTLLLLSLESYFIYSYFTEANFTSKTMSLYSELNTLCMVSIEEELLYDLTQEYLSTNTTAEAYFQPLSSYLPQFDTEIQSLEAKLLYTHFINQDLHDAYSHVFKSMFFQSLCEEEFYALSEGVEFDREECESIQSAAFLKGFQNALVGYSSNLEALRVVVEESQEVLRDDAFFNGLLNEQRFVEAQIVMQRYFRVCFQYLLKSLMDDIFNNFETHHTQFYAMFFTYLVLVCVVYFTFWRLFIYFTHRSLYVAQSMICIIPVSIIFNVKKIRKFIEKTFRTIMFNQ
jgi:PAS domain S-box-containing protein